ncbi:uncharacterized protein LOC34621617 [Cyclospora cayetanensis]|uniref:Uncharacterized protein LOC34621617 n=1 Tax=Cyclospora cayetanensis TaxID=88456 RepID=A0A6P6RRP3_9EIME|nr:uncharacterized protein LOC34621617 [Cyclospora cayetanensis]
MFASPLPPGPDVPCVSSVGPVGFANATSVQQKRREEQHYVFQKYPGKEFKETQSTRREPKTAVYSTADQAVLQPLRSLDPDSRDLNLTASLEAFVAGVQGQQHKDEHPTFVSSELSTHETVGGLRDQLQKVSSGAQGGEVHERRVIHTMNDYGSSAYMQAGVGSVFPEAYANSYVVTKEGEVTTAPGAATSYQVVLSDGTSYPSAVFPAGASREAARSTAPQTAAAPQMYSSPARVSADVAASYYPYTEAIPYAEAATVGSPTTAPGTTTNYYTSYYRRQFPVSPIVADSAIPGDDGIPAVSLPHERDRLVETNRLSTERHISPGDDTAGRPSTTSLAEPMLLVDGVTGLPLRGQTSIDRGTTLLSNPLANSRDCRLLTAKKKLLSRPMQLIHVNRWDGKEVLTVDEGARRWLGEISTRYIAVISICGELQTGKSGLANLLLDDSVMSSTLGFAVGTSVAAPVIAQGTRFVQRVESEGKTEGVWMSAVEAEGDKDNLVYLVLDFEGIGSKRKSVEHDQRLFTLALLVSHFLVFVTRGAVDSDTLFSLASASAWTQRLRVTHGGGADRQAQKPPTPSSHGVSPASPNAKGKPDAASSSKAGLGTSAGGGGTWRAPALLWVLQDFNMSMVDEQQNPLTAGDYLEALLALSVSRDVRGFSQLAAGLESPQIRMARQEVSELFGGDRDCVALPSPLGFYAPAGQSSPSGQASARALEAVSVSEFVPLYQRRLAQLRCRVFRDCKGRALDGTALTGLALTRILEKLVEGINGGEIPESVRLLGSIQHDECRRWKQVCEEAFTKELRDTFQAKLPIPSKELQEGAESLQRKYSHHFKIHAIGDDEVLRHYKTQLKEKLRRITDRALEENERHAEWKCRQKAKMLSDKLGIDQKISGKLYMDLQALNDDLALLRQEYNADIRGPRYVHQRVLNEYIDQLLSRGANAVADALQDLARDSERTAALLHQKTMDAERKGDKAVKLEQELQNKDYETEQLRRELEDEREQQTLQEERYKQETKELRRELAEQRETNQRLSALYHSRVLDEEDAYRYGPRRSKHSAVGLNDQARCFGNRCTLM